jgi:riboflavin biosynthesis pyrimidine reductase
MGLVRTLIEGEQEHAQRVLPEALRDLYGGDLHFPTSPDQRPYVIGNFVCTLDGVVSFKVKGRSGGSAISGSDLADRFIMGLLRASVDAVMVGARTVHDVSPEGLWIPEYTYPDAKHLYTDYRLSVLHKPKYPLVVVVSGSGRLELSRAVFRTPEVRTVVITTPSGRDALAKAGASRFASVAIHALDAVGNGIDPLTMIEFLRSQFGVQILLHEGGPTLFGQFLAAEAVDELFLTLSPQIAGRAARTNRPGIVQGVEFAPNSALWFQLLSLRERAQHLYLRYRWHRTSTVRGVSPRPCLQS